MTSRNAALRRRPCPRGLAWSVSGTGGATWSKSWRTSSSTTVTDTDRSRASPEGSRGHAGRGGGSSAYEQPPAAATKGAVDTLANTSPSCSAASAFASTPSSQSQLMPAMRAGGTLDRRAWRTGLLRVL